MKRLILSIFVALSLALPSFAEYQVYQYYALIKRPLLQQKGGATRLSDKLEGYLVTVCCYPCGADFGKGYQSWLFVTDRKLGKSVVFRIPCETQGSLYGNACDPNAFSDYKWVQPTAMDKRLAQRANCSSFWMRFCVDRSSFMFGETAARVELIHAGTGAAGFKENKLTDDPQAVWNPYIKSASGTVVGYVQHGVGFAYQPSNRSAVDWVVLTGTFNIKFDAKLTDEIRGTADWDEITRRILKHFGKMELDIGDAYDSDLMWSRAPLLPDSGEEE